MEMLTDKSTYLRRDSDGKEIWRAELLCDTCAELVGVTALGDKRFAFGSAALAVKEGELCVLADDNKWYKQSTGTEVTA